MKLKLKLRSVLIVATWLLGQQFALSFYNSSTGRWLNRDPIGEAGGIDQYGFVLNDAVQHFDAHGLTALEAFNVPGGYRQIDRCGSFQWIIKWNLTPPSEKGGYIIQRNYYSIQIESCDGKTSAASKSQSFREAWRVLPASGWWRFRSNDILPSNRDEWRWTNPESCNRGHLVVTSDATFQEGLAELPPEWQKGLVAEASRDQYSTYNLSSQVGGSTGNRVARSVQIDWDCCGRFPRPPRVTAVPRDSQEFIQREIVNEDNERFAKKVLFFCCPVKVPLKVVPPVKTLVPAAP